MNIWAIDKDISIKHLLIVLTDELGKDNFAITDRWKGELQAIGICKPTEEGLLAYIYTYGQEKGRYGINLAYPHDEDNAGGAYENMSLEKLVEMVRLHLDII